MDLKVHNGTKFVCRDGYAVQFLMVFKIAETFHTYQKLDSSAIGTLCGKYIPALQLLKISQGRVGGGV